MERFSYYYPLFKILFAFFLLGEPKESRPRGKSLHFMRFPGNPAFLGDPSAFGRGPGFDPGSHPAGYLLGEGGF
jgi:hypothetical protein